MIHLSAFSAHIREEQVRVWRRGRERTLVPAAVVWIS